MLLGDDDKNRRNQNALVSKMARISGVSTPHSNTSFSLHLFFLKSARARCESEDVPGVAILHNHYDHLPRAEPLLRSDFPANFPAPMDGVRNKLHNGDNDEHVDDDDGGGHGLNGDDKEATTSSPFPWKSVLALSLIGFLINCQPSEPYLTKYLKVRVCAR